MVKMVNIKAFFFNIKTYFRLSNKIYLNIIIKFYIVFIFINIKIDSTLAVK